MKIGYWMKHFFIQQSLPKVEGQFHSKINFLQLVRKILTPNLEDSSEIFKNYSV